MIGDKKAIFFDIDGTLMADAFSPMPGSAVEAVRRARENGHLCFIDTGRTWRLVRGIFDGQAEFDGYLLGCGTMILYQGEVLAHSSFSPGLSQRILGALERYRIDAILEGPREVFCRTAEEIYSDYFRKYAEKYRRLNFPDYTGAEGEYDKLFARGDTAADMERFREEFREELEFIDRGKGFYEILPKGCSKAAAIRFIAEHLGIPMENTAAIGDGNNDLPMLACAHRAVAMGNSTPEVLRMADYVTGTVEEDGIRDALQWLGVL